MCCGPGCRGGAVVGQRRLAVARALPARAAQACTLAARTAMTSQVSGLPAIVGGFAGCWRDDEFVGRIHHDGAPPLMPTGPLRRTRDPHIRPAMRERP